MAVARVASKVMPARRCRCIFSPGASWPGELAEGGRGHPSARCSAPAAYEHGLEGSNVNGSSLPNASGTPQFRNLAVRALCRWQASCTMAAVDVPLGAVDAVVKSPVAVLVVVEVAVAVAAAGPHVADVVV